MGNRKIPSSVRRMLNERAIKLEKSEKARELREDFVGTLEEILEMTVGSRKMGMTLEKKLNRYPEQGKQALLSWALRHDEDGKFLELYSSWQNEEENMESSEQLDEVVTNSLYDDFIRVLSGIV